MVKHKAVERMTLSIPEAAREIGCSERKLRDIIADRSQNGFPAVHLGRRIVVPRDLLSEWLRARATA